MTCPPTSSGLIFFFWVLKSNKSSPHSLSIISSTSLSICFSLSCSLAYALLKNKMKSPSASCPIHHRIHVTPYLLASGVKSWSGTQSKLVALCISKNIGFLYEPLREKCFKESLTALNTHIIHMVVSTQHTIHRCVHTFLVADAFTVPVSLLVRIYSISDLSSLHLLHILEFSTLMI